MATDCPGVGTRRDVHIYYTLLRNALVFKRIEARKFIVSFDNWLTANAVQTSGIILTAL